MKDLTVSHGTKDLARIVREGMLVFVEATVKKLSCGKDKTGESLWQGTCIKRSK